MTVVTLDISMSLDGYATAANVRPEEPMGDGGQQLHEWAFGEDEQGNEILAESSDRVGATIAGRRTYDLSIPWWGADGPGGTARTPTFIVSHGRPDDVPEGGVYSFVDDPLEALAQARTVAGDRDVDVFSPSIGQQLLRAGHIDEIRLHVAPVLLGAGTRLFENLGDEAVPLEMLETKMGPKATHLRYAISRGA
jgi:dihydrofolate reductase